VSTLLWRGRKRSTAGTPDASDVAMLAGQLTVFGEPVRKLWMSSSRRVGGAGQEIAAFTSSATFFCTTGLHFFSAYVTGHMSPSSRFAVSWKPRVE
jgi:hypothetical protein